MKKMFFSLLFIALVASGCSVKSKQSTMDILSPEEAKTSFEDFVNNNVAVNGDTVTVNSVGDSDNYSDYYKINYDIGDTTDNDIYFSKDGKRFFVQDASMSVDEYIQRSQGQNQNQTQAAQDIPKSDKPSVELFVMAFCPYGVQAENAMAPVVDLLGDKADIQVRFIVSASGDDLSSIQSLHGNIEGVEDARQLCIVKNYSQDIYWDYLMSINKDCYPVYSQGEKVYDSCWQEAAQNAGINISKVNSCLDSEGIDLINQENVVDSSYGVSGSPTLVINGVKSQSGRSPEAYKQAICNAFNEQPEECNTALDSQGGTASGGC